MSDIDNELRGLRDELTAAIPLPDVDHVTDRARARRKLQVGAIAAVIAVVAAVPIARALPFWVTVAKTDPAKTTYVVDFADPDHGYALTRTCERGTLGCTSTLYRTADGGQTWQPKRLPRAPRNEFWDVLYVLGPDNVTVATPIGFEKIRIVSTDGGGSWGVAQDLSSAGTAPLASGGMLTGACGAQPYAGNGCEAVGSIQPDSGRFLATPTQPPLIPLQVGPVPTEGGKWWVAGKRAGSDHPWLAVSADGGRTWSTSEMAKFAGPGGWAVVEHGNVMFATASSSDILSSVWRSTDGGRSWTRTWSDEDPVAVSGASDASSSGDSGVSNMAIEGPALAGDPVIADDGKLILPGPTTTYVGDNKGRNLRPAGATEGWVKWTRGGYLRMQGHSFALSGDGSHWREFTVG